MSWPMDLFIAFYVLSFVSIIGSTFVTVSILNFGSETLSTKLVLYLHISQLIQDIFVLPKIFNGNEVICQIAGWLHIYSGMANILVVTIMCISYRHLFFEDKLNLQKFFNKWLPFIVFGVPLVSLAPFSTNSYGPVHNSICSFQGSEDHVDTKASQLWFSCFLIWTLITGFLCCVILIHTFVSVYWSDSVLGTKLIKSLGLYAIATLILWVPRFFCNVLRDSVADKVANFLILIAGIAYVCIFLREKKSLQLFEQSNINGPPQSIYSERDSHSTAGTGGGNDDHSIGGSYINVDDLFSWDVDTATSADWKSNSRQGRNLSKGSANGKTFTTGGEGDGERGNELCGMGGNTDKTTITGTTTTTTTAAATMKPSGGSDAVVVVAGSPGEKFGANGARKSSSDNIRNPILSAAHMA